MNRITRATSGSVVGLLTTLLAGMPAVADDTELLLVDPGAAGPKPNILFIIDSSGSMSDMEDTKEIFDTNNPYPGSCNPDMLYWTEFDAVPSCDTSNTQLIAKSSFKCEAAKAQLEGIGIFADKMVQHRTGTSGFMGGDPSVARWQEIAPGNSAGFVECENDSGEHGDGTSPAAVYAQAGGDVALYTANKNAEISWRSWPTSQLVTVYDGNYLNYRSDLTTVRKSRLEIVQTTAKVVLESISDVNVGVMRFNEFDGGPVIHEVADLNTNRASIIAAIDGIEADGFTPLSETMYEANLYWNGTDAYYGETIDENPTALGALAITDPERYRAPNMLSCTKNFNILLTDGFPRHDEEPFTLVDDLPEWVETVGHASCTKIDGNAAPGTEQTDDDGECLEDIAEYMAKRDLAPSLTGVQKVATHTIGFNINLPILEETADVSGGEYFLAEDIESLSLALIQIFTNVNEEALSFAAPAVAVNSFNRTRNLNDLYLTAFQAAETVHWPGNLKKYRITGGQIVDANGNAAVDPATGFFAEGTQSFWSTGADGNVVTDGGAANEIPAPALRDLYTDVSGNPVLSDGVNHISTGNIGSFSLADFGLTGAAGEPALNDLINWARGADVFNEDNDPSTTMRNAMGDPLHSQPAAVVYGGTEDAPDVVVFTATNDGYVHAIDADTGEELWAFVPMEHLSKTAMLFFNPQSASKSYGVDGDIIPVVADRDGDGVIESGDDDFVYLLFGMRRGGSSYYALDVTNREQPKVKWHVTNPNFGQSWSAPTVARVDMDEPTLNDDKAVVIIGGGYDPVHDAIAHPSTADASGAGIYFLDLETGAVLWEASADASSHLTLAGMTRAIPNQVRAVDLNGDNFADRLYASDMGGQVWRFDIFNGMKPTGLLDEALVAGGVIAQLGAEGTGTTSIPNTRRFYNAPDISIFNDTNQNRRYLAISIGSGYRAHPLNNGNADAFFSIRDRDVFNRLSQAAYNTYDVVTLSDLVDVSGSTGAIIGPGKDGWRFTLPANEKILASSTTFDNEIFFVSFSPDSTGASACAAGVGRNFLYRVSVINGDPIADLDGIVSGGEDAARRQELAQSGIAPSPRFLFPEEEESCPDGTDCTPPSLACVGVECFDPGFVNNPVRTLWTQDGVE